jgi:hypothetical protein
VFRGLQSSIRQKQAPFHPLFIGLCIKLDSALNLPFSEWTTVFPNPRLCKVLLDRITDRAHIIETGRSHFVSGARWRGGRRTDGLSGRRKGQRPFKDQTQNKAFLIRKTKNTDV